MGAEQQVYSFSILWAGSECDGVARIMERDDGERYLKTSPSIVLNPSNKASVDMLEERLCEYESVIEQTRYAIRLLNGEAILGHDASWMEEGKS